MVSAQLIINHFQSFIIYLTLRFKFRNMKLKERISAFATLGNELGGFNDSKLLDIINCQHLKNAWFTPENVRFAISSIAESLTEESIEKWLSKYPELSKANDPKTIAVIMAGNIPLVGFHDFICTLITGNRIIAKISSKDSELIIYMAKMLCEINNGFDTLINFTKNSLSGFDAVIATGSNNTSRYFEYYFGKYPNIIRKNRNSIAVIDGNESEHELKELGRDVFSYFGLGCRNVSKIFIPTGYELSNFTDNWNSYDYVINNNKYANNYDFYKAVYLVNKDKFTDAGYLLLKEEKAISSPVSVLHYEYYNTKSDLKTNIETHKNNIQCIVSKNDIPFGKSQNPFLWDYSDGIDTIDFLLYII